MKTTPFHHRRHRRGVALMLVLACVVLMALLIVGFLASIGAEVKSSKVYANGSSVKLLGQSAVDLVMAEIRDATRDGTLCWASQPGMIRTYKNTGAVVNYYKLYSDDAMVTATFDQTKALVPDGTHSVGGNTVAWYNQPGVYVDLNEPVSVGGVNQYPIVDGDSADLVSYTFNTTAGTAGYSTTPLPPLMFPSTTPVSSNTVKVLGPLNLNQPAVAGFWLSDKTPVSTQSPNQAPMPVKWLYVLQDGKIATPDSGSTNGTVTFTNSKITLPDGTVQAIAPSQANPITGRIAFWTDDETSKININTASEGTYWDIPRANSGYIAGYVAGTTSPSWSEIMNGLGTAATNYNHGTSDNDLRSNMPIFGEFQRYPGHPATTSLSTVLNLTNPETIYSTTPRLGPGGSTEGTVQTSQDVSVPPIAANGNPLFASVDEFLFQPAATGSARALASSLGGGTGGLQTLDQNLLKKARFFLTATSRAPDVNLFNQPRVSIWPLSLDSSTIHHGTSPYDQLIAFCSTIGSSIYYFQRTDPTDPHVDLPVAANTTGLGRNRAVLEYLRYLMGQEIPGFAGNFASKYNKTNPNVTGTTGTDRDQILTEIFDYIRATNLRDPTVIAAGKNPYTYQISTAATVSTNGTGQVVPIEDTTTGTRGFGRFETVEGASILFIASADSSAPNSQPAVNPVTPDPSTGLDRRRIQMIFLPQFFDPSFGSVFDMTCFSYQVSGLDAFKAGGTSLGLPSLVSATQSADNYSGEAGFWGDQLGAREALNAFSTTTYPNTVASSFVSAFVDVPETAGTFAFTGGDITFTLMTPAIQSTATNPGTVLQKVTLRFPSATLPLPRLAPSNFYDWDWHPQVAGGPYNLRYFNPPPLLANPNTLSGPDYAGDNQPVTAVPPSTTAGSQGGRLATVSNNNFNNSYAWVTDFDTIRSVAVPADIRLIAAQKDLTSSTAIAAKYYTGVGPFNSGNGGFTSPTVNNAVLGAHTLFRGNSTPIHGAVAGHLVSTANYDNAATAWMNTLPGPTTDNGLSYFNTPLTATPGGGNTMNHYNFQDVFNPANGSALLGVVMAKTSPITSNDILGDWDNGIAVMRDGPFINKADEGDEGSSAFVPYDWKGSVGNLTLTAGQFTPNRLIPSAVMFGSLPTGVFSNRPWQTLLFRAGPIGHTGLGTSVNTPVAIATAGSDQGPPYSNTPVAPATTAGPPDHLLLDLFSMPVVEPYAISEPLSTAGRINMNYLMVPFTYINRDTGLRALLKSEQVVSIADGLAPNYKQSASAAIPNGKTIRFPVNMDSTLSQFYTRRFNNNDIFRSPSEICDIDIVPYDTTQGGGTGIALTTAATPTRVNMDGYWKTHRLTGDNSRERIYATLYPRLTTKSNTFTIHFRVQALKSAAQLNTTAASWQQWHEGTDQVVGEYRGSQTIERYVDTNDTTLPDFTANPSTTTTLAPYYKFRVVSVKQFAP